MLLMENKAVITENAMTLYKQRYLSGGESVDELFRRVAGGNEEFISLMDEGLFLPNSPALFNMGLNNGCTSSACFVFNIEDCMHRNDDGSINDNSIVETRAKAIAVAKAGGGVGYYGGFLRAKNKPIKSIHRKACGPVSVLKDLHGVSHLITQGGKRELAQMFVLPVDHEDIMEFIHCKDKDPQGLGSFNISTSWKKGQLNDPKYDSVFLHQVESAWSHGCPGVFFEHWVNENNPNPHLGLMLAPNPCVTGETLILTRKGQFPIASLKGKEVEVWNGREWSKTTPKQTGENQKILKITFSNGAELRCTPYHGFRLADGKKVQAQGLIVGDCLEKWEDNPPVETKGQDNACSSAYLAGFFCGDGFAAGDKQQQMITFYGPKVKVGRILAEQNLVTLIGKYDQEHDRQRANLNVVVPAKNEVPVNGTTNYKIEWLEGLLDSDGCIAYSDESQRSYSYQISSVDRGFLADVAHMLRGMGIPTTVATSHEPTRKVMPGGEYDCQTCYRLCISAWHSARLIKMGLEPLRLPSSDNEPSRDAARFIRVVSVESAGTAEAVYCFNEPLRHCGVFNGILTSQCGETPNRNDEPCSLGSINLWRFINLKTREFLWDKFQKACRIATRLLDSILDRNTFPHHNIDRAARLTRKLGLGVMGWADTLALLGIHYDTDKAVRMAEKVMDLMSVSAVSESKNLADEKGPYPGFSWGQTKDEKRRNETNTSIAPTGTIAVLNNASGSIEPHFSLEWTRTTAEGIKLQERIPVWEHLDGFRPKVANEIGYEWHIKHQAAFQRHTDLGVSKCVVGDTLVLTGHGLKMIEDIHQERGDDQFRSLRIPVCGEDGMTMTDHFYSGGVRDTIRFKTRQGSELEGTPNHRVRVERNGEVIWSRLDELNADDLIVIHTGQEVYADQELISPELASLLGHAVADGSLAQNWLAMFHTDKDVTDERVRLLMIPEVRSKVSIGRNTRNTDRSPSVVKDKRNSVVKVQQNSRPMVDWLENDIGLKRRAANKSVPPAVLQSNREVQQAFLVGLFTDCGVANKKTPNLTFNTASRVLSRQVRAMLMNMGMYSSAQTHRVGEKDYYRVSLTATAAMQFANEIGFVETSRTKQFKLWSGYKPSGTNPNGHMPTPRHGYRVEKVLSISKGKAPVFDISVPDGVHAFVTEGMISHNTINLPNSATKEDVGNAYKMMHDMKCKGGTVFRDGCRDEQVLVAKKTKSVYSNGVEIPRLSPEIIGEVENWNNRTKGTDTPAEIQQSPPEKSKATKPGFIHRFRVDGSKYYLAVSVQDGKPYEMFITAKKAGSTTMGMLSTWAITFSKAMQSGVSLEKLCKAHLGSRFEPNGFTDDKEIPICTSVPDYICKWLLKQFSRRDLKELVSTPDSGMFCPTCNSELMYVGGCLTCRCGWSKCG